MSKTHRPGVRAVVTQQIELPTPLQQVKLDSLMVRLWRAGREVYSIKDDSELPDTLHRKDAHAALMVFYKKHPEGVLYVHNDGRTIDPACHKGLFDLIIENAKAGEWPPGVPENYYDALRLSRGEEPDVADIEALHREYGWID